MSATPVENGGEELGAKISAQGDKVRQLKSNKADKAEIDAAVQVLLSLKVYLAS